MESSWHTCLKSIEINGLANVSKIFEKMPRKGQRIQDATFEQRIQDQPVVGGIKMISGGFFAPWLAG